MLERNNAIYSHFPLISSLNHSKKKKKKLSVFPKNLLFFLTLPFPGYLPWFFQTLTVFFTLTAIFSLFIYYFLPLHYVFLLLLIIFSQFFLLYLSISSLISFLFFIFLTAFLPLSTTSIFFRVDRICQLSSALEYCYFPSYSVVVKVYVKLLKNTISLLSVFDQIFYLPMFFFRDQFGDNKNEQW